MCVAFAPTAVLTHDIHSILTQIKKLVEGREQDAYIPESSGVYRKQQDFCAVSAHVIEET